MLQLSPVRTRLCHGLLASVARRPPPSRRQRAASLRAAPPPACRGGGGRRGARQQVGRHVVRELDGRRVAPYDHGRGRVALRLHHRHLALTRRRLRLHPRHLVVLRRIPRTPRTTAARRRAAAPLESHRGRAASLRAAPARLAIHRQQVNAVDQVRRAGRHRAPRAAAAGRVLPGLHEEGLVIRVEVLRGSERLLEVGDAPLRLVGHRLVEVRLVLHEGATRHVAREEAPLHTLQGWVLAAVRHAGGRAATDSQRVWLGGAWGDR
eukprot:scaffold8305_cov51-Phaeocystis_antarctica.AAC.3